MAEGLVFGQVAKQRHRIKLESQDLIDQWHKAQRVSVLYRCTWELGNRLAVPGTAEWPVDARHQIRAASNPLVDPLHKLVPNHCTLPGLQFSNAILCECAYKMGSWWKKPFMMRSEQRRACGSLFGKWPIQRLPG